jgi:hypothetical protein
MNHKILIPLLVVALVTLACGINIDLTDTDIKTGPTQTEVITVPFLDPATETAEVTIAFGAGNLNINPGGTDALISGIATFNVADFRPELTIEGNDIRLEQGDLDLNGIPSFSGDLINEWDLAIGNAPLELEINAGAYSGSYELGGLSLQRLEISDGAAEVQVSFSEPNPVEMSLFKYSTGASKITLEGLGNANCSQLIFRSGAGAYTLDFSGDLTRDIEVTIESGVSSITIIVPEGSQAILTSNGLLSITATGDWEEDGNIYTVLGDGPTITIEVDMGAGNLILETE